MNIQAAEAPTTVATLVMTGISKSFGGVAALTDVSLEVRPGEVHALLGENGAGKSTLMNVATGTIRPDTGSMVFRGDPIDGIDPRDATRLGIAFVHQHPAVLPDMTVYENLLVALPPSVFADAPSREEYARSLLDRVNLRVHLSDRVETLTVAQKHLLEIAKAIAVEPALLVLDEPTAPLGEDAVRLLFRLVRDFVAGGTSVVYITHRLAEVRELADRVTVLRDGRLRATAVVDEISDRELLALIVGRQLDSTFPPKYDGPSDEPPNFIIDGLSGPGFRDVSITARRGEIIGVAGVVGNGQSDLLRSLAGLSQFEGTVSINGTQVTSKHLLSEAAYLPADRLSEGLMMRLTVRENAAISALQRFRTGRLLNRKRELGMVGDTLGSLSVKAASLDAPVSSLSGGNQQKVMVARALLSEPELVLADEPTQGVDVGARADIYGILREVSASGIPVIVASSDAKELEGLCDTVIVMSRGHVVDVLRGDDLTEERMIHAAVSSTTSTVGVEDIIDAEVDERTAVRRAKVRRFVQGDYAPAVLLVAVMVLLGAFIFAQNDRYLGAFNISAMLLLVSALGFIAMGQTIALLTGGIDLSVGPLVGFLVVIGSFFILNESSTASILLGFAAMAGTSIVVGLLNGTLIRYVKFTAIAATLTVYIALQGMSFILRPTAGGYINAEVSRLITTKVGPIPVAFIVLVLVVIGLEYALRRTPWGWRLRAAGSDEESARRVGVEINPTIVMAYVATSLLTFLGAIMLMTQIGVGDPAQGVAYTLSSITAVVLGGTSLLGGRGTFVGTLFGAMLLVQVLNATVFLRLDQMWQYILQGVLILAAAILYAIARSKRRRRVARKV
ncbi:MULTISPECIES: ATP-binding cassette domain-containing protein [unclassified Agromyces]|uniref:ATP-binding cassette domain-containing protein n=1 Tax=unclassified Agromyces TaxID=2639701 RepID=UPI003014A5D5